MRPAFVPPHRLLPSTGIWQCCWGVPQGPPIQRAPTHPPLPPLCPARCAAGLERGLTISCSPSLSPSSSPPPPTLSTPSAQLGVGHAQMLDKILYEEEVRQLVLTFQQQFHYGVFYAYMRLREQEVGVVWWG